MTDYNETYRLAPTVSDVIVAAKASAWDQGWLAGMDDEQAAAEANQRGELSRGTTPNPYARLMRNDLIAEAKKYAASSDSAYATNLINRLVQSLEDSE
jgi:hypothetical protein